MSKRIRALGAALVVLAVAVQGGAAPAQDLAFTVSMPRPSTHYFHVELRCGGGAPGLQEFRLPVLSPGYYMIMDYPKNVMNFKAVAADGAELPWHKTAKNAWAVTNGAGAAFTLSYDVYAFAHSIAESSLDDSQAFLSPTSLFLYPANRLRQPVTVTVRPFEGWNRVATGLERVPGQAWTFTAPDFDILYDSPMLLGNQEVLTFDVQGVPHTFSGRDLGDFDRARFVGDLKAMVAGACRIIGEMPYTHYAFLAIGPGGGGLEHLNSQVITFDGNRLRNPAEYRKVMSFISHEFFHNFNVKRIRPLALGPFDYDRENYTDLLWVSEGFTVYYEDQVLLRNGFFTREEYFERIRLALRNFEGIPGHRYQTAAASSFDAWFGYFNHNEHQENTTISYYDKGLALAVLLDFKIRHETGNKRSLDDVMRTLYRTYAKELGRGFSDEEFRRVCETTAGCALPELFETYVASTQDPDYAKYFAYAGLTIDTAPTVLPGGFLGADCQGRDGKVVVTRVELDGPASLGGLSVEDVILAVDGRTFEPGSLEAYLKERAPGAVVKVLVGRRGRTRTLEVTLGQRVERSFLIKAMPEADALQKAIRTAWLAGV